MSSLRSLVGGTLMFEGLSSIKDVKRLPHCTGQQISTINHLLLVSQQTIQYPTTSQAELQQKPYHYCQCNLCTRWKTRNHTQWQKETRCQCVKVTQRDTEYTYGLKARNRVA